MNLPLDTSVTYHATNVWRESLKIHLEENVVNEDRGANSTVVRRLLRSLLTANQSTGIVILREVGPKIVEVRTVMRGAHKRLIGCLDGRVLTLKFLIEIKSTGETYSRRINPHLCQER